MELVHALVTEILANLVDALEAAHDEPLEVEFGGDAHIHVDTQRVEMGDEGTCRGAAGNALQRGRLHLRVAMLVEKLAHGAQYGGALEEGFLHTVVHYKVHIALAGAKLGVVELVVGHAILIFHDGQGLETLAQQRQFLGVNGNLARLCAEHHALHADEVANVEQFLEHLII